VAFVELPRWLRSTDSASESDLVKLTRLVLAACFAISLAFAIGFCFAGKPNPATWFGALTLIFLLADLEIYWVHSLNHPHELSRMFEILAASLIGFVLIGSAYSAFTGSVATPTFRRAMVATPGTSFAFGGLHMGLSDHAPPMLIAGQMPFTIYTEEGRLFCDVKVFSLGSHDLITIKHNVIESLPSGWDYNSNDHGMEIVNDARQPMFQMYYEAPTIIRVEGIIVVPTMVFLAQGDSLETISFASPALPEAIARFKLDRIFKYPSAMFQGIPN
jgi:hypothetical protein